MSTDKYTNWMTLLSAILGVWIIAVPFIWSIPEMLLWSNLVAGAIIALLAAYGAYRLFEEETVHLGIPVIAAIAGLWVIVSPFAFADVAQAVLASNVIAGFLVFVLSTYVAYIGRERGFATSGGAAV